MTASTSATAARNPCADIFNDAVAAAGISAAWQLGLLDEVHTSGSVALADFAKVRDLRPEAVRAIVDSLVNVRILGWDASGAEVLPGPRLEEALEARGFFHWLVAGSGELFASLADKATADGPQRVRRDGWSVGVASREIGHEFIDPVFLPVLDSLTFTSMADLGCGSGERLIRQARRDPAFRGIGVDVSQGALDLAAAAVREAGVADQIEVVKADVRDLQAVPEFASVEVVTCLLMGHDFWPRDTCVQTLRSIRAAFPKARHFLLVDTCRSGAPLSPGLGVFSIGFEVAHALMGVALPTLDDWRGVFADGGWRMAAEHPIETPAHSAVFSLVPLDGAGGGDDDR